MKIFSLVLPILLLAGCVTADADRSRYNIDYAPLSAQLYVEGVDGFTVPPFGRQIVDVDGYGIGPEALRLLPGKHWIHHSCPDGSNGHFDHGPPSIQYDFKVGKKYLLRCKDGWPVISPYEN